jgi:hypothetical protein
VLERLDKLPVKKSPLEQRIEQLEGVVNNPTREEHVENAKAILEGYKTGTLQYIPGQFYIFENGSLVAGPRPLSECDYGKILWEEFPGPKGVWIEEVSLI